MALTHIEYGSLASSSVINNNFEYLDNRITTVANNLTSTASSISSNIASMNSSFSETTQEISSDLSDFKLYHNALRADFDTQNEAPDYSNAETITFPYTAAAHGYVYAKIQTVNGIMSVFINNNPVMYGQYGNILSTHGSMYRVGTGDKITITGTCQEACFYPIKKSNRSNGA